MLTRMKNEDVEEVNEKSDNEIRIKKGRVI